MTSTANVKPSQELTGRGRDGPSKLNPGCCPSRAPAGRTARPLPAGTMRGWEVIL
jgi:hypothetical protein